MELDASVVKDGMALILKLAMSVIPIVKSVKVLKIGSVLSVRKMLK